MALKKRATPNAAGINKLYSSTSKSFEQTVANRARKGAGNAYAEKLRVGGILTGQRIANFRTGSGYAVRVVNGKLALGTGFAKAMPDNYTD